MSLIRRGREASASQGELLVCTVKAFAAFAGRTHRDDLGTNKDGSMSTRGFKLSRRFAILAGLALVWGLVPSVNGARPVSAAQVQAAPEAPDDLEAFPADREPIKIDLIWNDNSSNESKFEVE